MDGVGDIGIGADLGAPVSVPIRTNPDGLVERGEDGGRQATVGAAPGGGAVGVH